MRSAAAALLLVLSAAAREDTSAPVIEHTPVIATLRGAKFVQVFAKITDESKFFPQVFYRYGPGDFQKPIDMKAVKGQKDQWGANIPIKGDLVEYYLEAYDELGNGPGRSGDPDRPYRVDTSGEPPVLSKANPAPIPQPAPAPVAKPAPQPAAKPWQPPPPAPAPVVQAPAPRPVVVQRPGRVWTWVVGGVGLGVLGGGLIAANEFKTQDDTYQRNLSAPGSSYASLNSQYTANKSLGQKATILMIAGGALVAGAVVLFFVEGGSFSGGSGGDGALHF